MVFHQSMKARYVSLYTFLVDSLWGSWIFTSTDEGSDKVEAMRIGVSKHGGSGPSRVCRNSPCVATWVVCANLAVGMVVLLLESADLPSRSVWAIMGLLVALWLCLVWSWLDISVSLVLEGRHMPALSTMIGTLRLLPELVDLVRWPCILATCCSMLRQISLSYMSLKAWG